MSALDEDFDRDDTEDMPADLRAELAAPNVRKLVDPRTLPVRIYHLKAAGQCGAAALHSFQGDGTDTIARRLGTGAHALLLGKPVALWDQPSEAWLKAIAKAEATGKPIKGKPSKAPRNGEAWSKFQREHAGDVIMIDSEMEAAKRIDGAIRSHPIASRLLFDGAPIFERSIIWSMHGRARQSTPDMRKPDVLVELKTTRSADPRRFPWDVLNLGYHAQLADQRAAIKHETGKAPREVYIVAVETKPPWIVQVFEVAESALEKGDQLREMWMERLQMYEATNMWGGYSDRVELLELPERNADVVIADPDWLSNDEPEGERQ